ncbi:MAG: hypothetical protein RMJ82_05065 [Gemmatales bacterium]|nr:hypothetical protein [Gemmatales bacterium]
MSVAPTRRQKRFSAVLPTTDLSGSLAHVWLIARRASKRGSALSEEKTFNGKCRADRLQEG